MSYIRPETFYSAYHVYIPNQEYETFLYDRIRDIAAKRLVGGVPHSYPHQMVVKLCNDGNVCISWNEVDSTSYSQLDFAKIEQVVQDHINNYKPSIIIDGHELKFNLNGDIHIGCITVSREQICRIYDKSTENYRNNEQEVPF
jgi:hypothetical protein